MDPKFNAYCKIEILRRCLSFLRNRRKYDSTEFPSNPLVLILQCARYAAHVGGFSDKYIDTITRLIKTAAKEDSFASSKIDMSIPIAR